MKRKVFDKIINWDAQTNGKAFLLTGAACVGKTYLALELAKNFHDSYLYLNPKNDFRLRSALIDLSLQESYDFPLFLQRLYSIPAEWFNEFLIILDDFDYYPELIKLAESITHTHLHYHLLLITTLKPNNNLSNQCNVASVTPLEFDEYLKAIGSEWYTEIIQAHYQTKKKIPEIVHTEMLNLFRDYLRIGGMPSAVNEYLHSETLDNISSVHRNIYQIQQSQFKRYAESSIIRLNQLEEHLSEQLIKENKNYRYNLIRKGATHTMYRTELQYLIDLHLVNKIERADFTSTKNEIQISTHENQFRLYPIDSGILASLLYSETGDFTDETEEESNSTSSDKLYQLLSETYLLQTLVEKSYNPVFWESGSLSKIDFISTYDNCIIPIDVKIYENKRSKSLHVFRQKYPIHSYIKFCTQNFEVINNNIICPIYSLFCL